MNAISSSIFLRAPRSSTDSAVTAGTGNPLKSAPVPEGEKNRYSFIFPLRPGVTQFEVAYQLPYSGSANLDPKSVYPLEHFVAMLPKADAVHRRRRTSTGFKPMNDPSQPDSNVQVASNTTPSQNLAFKISGEGTLELPTGKQRGTKLGSRVTDSEPRRAVYRPPRRRTRPAHRRSRPAAEIPLADPRKHRGSFDPRRSLRSRAPTIRSPRSGPPNARFFSARFFRAGSHAGRRLRSR